MNTLESCTIDSPNNKTEECAKFIIDEGTYVFTLSEVMVPGREYTFSCWIRSEANGSIVVSGDSFLSTTEWQYYVRTFAAEETDLVIAFTTEGTYYVYHAQLEIGNKATDWTPAVEDTIEAMKQAQESADTAQGTASDASERVGSAESTLQLLNEQISMLVTDGNGSSLMTQTADGGWTFGMGPLLEIIQAASDGISGIEENLTATDDAISNLQKSVSDLATTAEYIRLGTYKDQPCIELSESDSDFKLLITNTQIVFVNGTSIPAYINDEALFIDKAEIVTELRLGKFAWAIRDNGNLGLTYKG